MSGDWGGERHGAGPGQLTTSLNSESDSERLSPRDAGIYRGWTLSSLSAGPQCPGVSLAAIQTVMRKKVLLSAWRFVSLSQQSASHSTSPSVPSQGHTGTLALSSLTVTL